MREQNSTITTAPIGRRSVLAGTAAALAAPALIGRAHAQENRVVVETWGGDYANLLKQNVEDPILKPAGVDVLQDFNDEPPRIAKMYAQRRLPHGTSDVDCVQAVSAYGLNEAGILEELDATKVPNFAHVDKRFLTDYFAPHIWSPQVLIYNPDRVKEPPTSFGDLLDPKYKGKVGFPDVNAFYVIMAASVYANGTSTDFDAAKELMQKLNDNGLHLYPSTDAGGPPFKTGEIDVGVMWLARVNMWQNAGIPVKASFQKEGCITYISGMSIPKNAPNKKGAYDYLNAMLEPSAQQGFAAKMGYLPTVDNAPLSGKVAQQLALPADLKLVVPDFAVTSKVQADMQDWWKKTAHGA
jgi:putative spermidine/putrescine transport system substrate-binding protein